MTARYNSELANGLGNLASRVTAMVGRYFDGVLPAQATTPAPPRQRSPPVAAAAAAADAAIGDSTSTARLAAIWTTCRSVNGYLTEQAPWQVAKDDVGRARRPRPRSCYATAEALRVLAVLLNPVMPEGAPHRCGSSLGRRGALGRDRRSSASRTPVAGGSCPAGATVTKGEPLFPRLDGTRGPR